jgi:UDP-N-acetylmuramyl pentapeptide synthase
MICLVQTRMHRLGEEPRLPFLFPAFDLVGLVGKDMKFAADKNPKSLYFETPAKALAWLKLNNLEGFTLLLKGSRGLKMEQLIEEL